MKLYRSYGYRVRLSKIRQTYTTKKTTFVAFNKCIKRDANSIKNKKKRPLSLFEMCPRRESNPYDRFGSQDFKSCVSTSSTTGATLYYLNKKSKHMVWISIGAKDRARTGHPDLGKVVLYQMSYFRI